MSKSIDSQLNEALRDALVAYYLGELVPNTKEFADAGLADKIKTANDLYEYKLLDVQVSQDVPTSPVASAIASLQQYINGALMGMEPGYETKVMEDHLITQWREIISQYPIWAANQQLQYYPEAYIDPSLRMSKSTYFQQLENDLNQNKIHIDTTQKAVLGYLASFEEVANLTIINGYINTVDFKNGMYYFIGKSRVEGAYYWRSVDMSQRTYKDLTGTNPDRPKFDYPQPGAWSDWHKAALPISASAIERTIRPVLFNNRLFVFWVEYVDSSPDAVSIEHNQPPEPGAPVTTVKTNPMLRLNMVYKKYDESWSVPQTVIEAWGEAPAPIESIVVQDSESLPDTIFVAMYAGFNPGAESNGAEDNYRFLRTASISKAFIVVPMFPESGHVSSLDASVESGKAHVLKVCRMFAMHNAGRFQFEFLGAVADQKIISLKSVSSKSLYSGSNGWDYEGAQELIADANLNVDVKYNSQTKSIEFNSRIMSSFQRDVYCIKLNVQGAGPLDLRFVIFVRYDQNPSIAPFLYLEQGSMIELVDSDVLAPGGKNIFEVRSKIDDRFDYAGFIRDFLDSTFCDLPPTPNGGSVSIAGKFLHREVIRLLRFQPWNMRLIISRISTPTYRLYEVTDSSGGYVFEYAHVIRRPEKISAMPLENSNFISLLESTKSHFRNFPDRNVVSFLIDPDTLLPDWNVTWPEAFKAIPLVHGIKVFRHGVVVGFFQKLSLVELEFKTVHNLRVLIAPRITLRTSLTSGGAEFMDFAGSAISTSDDKSGARRPIRMNTLFAGELTRRANTSLENLLTWETQGLEEPPLQPPAAVNQMDFHGANGKYFWELFLHLPFLVSQRLNLEQQFDESERWLGFIFDPSRKQDSNGRPNYWNVRPLVADTQQMDHATRKPADPDGIASSHPVHYRKAIYLHYLKNLLDRGDAAYRQLTPDSLGEAKLWYVRVLDLLGPRPDINLVDSWTPMTLQALSNSTNAQLRDFERRLIEQDQLRADSAQANEGHSLYQFAEPLLYLRTFSPDPTLAALDSDHLRLPINTHLIRAWDIAESRLDNLRNNRTLDGKPLSLGLFAAPLNPRDLLAAYGQGAATGGSTRLLAQDVPHYRFRVMHERASNAVQTLIQFGSTLLSLIERREQAQLQELQYQQAWEFAQFAIDLQLQAQRVDEENQKALLASQAIAQQRYKFYALLSEEVVNAGEITAGSLHLVGRVAEGVGAVAHAVAAGVIIAPNAAGGVGGAIVGIAANGVVAGASMGGWRLEGVPKMVSAAAFGVAALSHGAAEAADRTEQFRRRHQEWTHARDQAALEIEQIEAQLQVLAAQSRATTLQLQQAQDAQAHALATYAFLGSRFSNTQLYQWLNGQFANFYYQVYDAALALCLATEACWQFEIADYTSRFIQAGAWNDSYRGLGAGESLKLQLLKMEAAYLGRHERRLEISKTVSLRQLPDKDASSALNQSWDTLKARLIEDGSVEFELTQSLFDNDFPGHILRRIKRVSISLPVILGPYEDIRATLTQSYSAVQMSDGSLKENLRASQQVVLSGGVDDDGLFTFDFNDERYLPFEGTGAVSRWLLHFPNHLQQQPMLESLNDIIVHVRYTSKATS